jgi:tryptophan-rich sensory protein
VGLCLLVGAASGAMTRGSLHTWYLTLNQPPGTPPVWLFASVWSGLLVMIGLAAWRVWRAVGAGATLRLWGWQLLANAFWTPAFFGAHSPLLGLVVVVMLAALVLLTTRAFVKVDRLAGWLMMPYLMWIFYAGYLNIGFWWLNAGTLY